MWCAVFLEPTHLRAASNLLYYQQILATDPTLAQPCSSDEDFGVVDDMPVNPRPMHTYKGSWEFLTYERLCRGEQTHVWSSKLLHTRSLVLTASKLNCFIPVAYSLPALAYVDDPVMLNRIISCSWYITDRRSCCMPPILLFIIYDPVASQSK